MTRYESTVREVAAPQQAVYDMLNDLNNINKFIDMVPEEQRSKLSFTSDSVSAQTPAGAVEIKVVNREAPKMIKFETVKSPVSAFFWVQVLPVTQVTSKMRLTLDVDLNFFMKQMLDKRIKDAMEKIADVLQNLPYGS